MESRKGAVMKSRTRTCFFKLLVLTLLFVLSMSCLSFAGKKVKIKVTKKTIYMTQGETKKLSGGGKAKWKKVSGPVSLKKDKNGKKATVTATGAGTAKVTASVGKKKRTEWTINITASASGSGAAAAAAGADTGSTAAAGGTAGAGGASSGGGSQTASTSAVQSGDTAGMNNAYEAQVYKKLLSMRNSYPEGMRYDNSTPYDWEAGLQVGYYHTFGCAAFATSMSDAIFGKQAKVYNSKKDSLGWIHAGDILFYNMGTAKQHIVIVLRKVSGGIAIAEGNYHASSSAPGAVHWGRIIPDNQVFSNLNYVLTRYSGFSSDGTVTSL